MASAHHLRVQARLLTERRRALPPVLPDLARLEVTVRGAGPGELPVTGRVAELALGRRPGAAGRLAVAAVPALRMTLGTGVAGGLVLALGLGHGYWAAISAAALHSVNLRTTAQRAAQRTLGTLAGLLIALAVLAAGPGPMVLAVVIVLLEFLLEYVVLCAVLVTPLALLMSDLAAPTSAEGLILDRGLGSLLGTGVGLLCALLVVHDRAARRVERALAGCRDASDRAEHSLGAGALSRHTAQVSLAAAVVELREADDAAAGELLQSGVDPAVLAAEEQRAYLLLDRLLHGG
ncbi:FUSC family protein [Streptomyces sp. TLI_171]|uniref:FUSC family protein n=1 Tax=Streptomyces sp. TLI_171 TaxID=1938859 RepID=UPI000C60D346|nr:FUSC family protein [Streptomyces sp. TLI_171]RKE23530.1 fusaric acid resistance family protein [Streptomyces sp. TLI_171]